MNKDIIDDVLDSEPGAPGFLDGRFAWWVCCACVIVLGLIVALPALDSLPLDSHEIFVAQSTREMSVRGDWLVPTFNGVPRLNKPPMNYWLTGVVAGVAGALPDVAPAHARLVSALAGLGLVGLALALGVALYDRLTALLAGLVLVSSAGYFSFTHDARPDMLYAFFTTLMLAAGIHVLRAPAGAPSRLAGAVGVMWVACACATLTKGPHLPALALVGLVVQAALQARDLRAPGRRLRLLPGLAIVTLPSLAWWGWLRVRVEPATLGDSQLAGTLLTPAWSRLGDPYYLYRPLEMLLPWLPLVLLALAGLCLRPARRDTGWLWWPLAVAAVGLSFGKQYRFFYLLPLLVPLVLILAHSVATVFRATLTPWQRQLVQLALLLQGVLALACAGWVLVASGRLAWLTPPILSLVAGSIGAWGAWRMLRRRDDGAPAARGLAVMAALATFTALIWPGGAMTGVLWSRERFEGQALVELAAAEARAGRPLATLGVSPSLYVYAANRRVRALNDATALTELAREAVQGVAVVARSDRLTEILPPLHTTEVGRVRRGSRDDVLVRVQYIAP